MADQKKIAISEYKYPLPDEKIPKFPAEQRDGSKLLVYRSGSIIDEQFLNIADYIFPDSLMVFNNTKVIQARIGMKKETGAKLEVFCLEPFLPSEYNQAFIAENECQWLCMVGNLKKWKDGPLIKELAINGETVLLEAHKMERFDKEVKVLFKWDRVGIQFSQILEAAGNLPIPPYLNRDTEEEDYDRYQTVYSLHKGSVAAPTAGLHFTDAVFEKLAAKNIQRGEVTLHVGAGTFRPVQTNTLEGHDMHTEHFSVSLPFLLQMKQYVGSITAVGTTSVRTLESLYWIAEQIKQNSNMPFLVRQWTPYELRCSLTVQQALDVLIEYCQKNNAESLNASTQLMIAPGYDWKFVNRIVTNFHQPESTLLLLVSAFVGTEWKRIYDHALQNEYRFLSYGDSSVLYR